MRLGWRAWTVAGVLALALHAPLLWVGWVQRTERANNAVTLDVQLTAPEPVEIPQPDSLAMRWSLGGEPDQTAPRPEFARPRGNSSMQLSSGLTGFGDAGTALARQDTDARQLALAELARLDADIEPEPQPEAADEAETAPPAATAPTRAAPDRPAERSPERPAAPAAPAAVVDDPVAAVRAPRQPPARSSPFANRAAAESPPVADPDTTAIDDLVDAALRGTDQIRTPKPVEPAELPPRRTPTPSQQQPRTPSAGPRPESPDRSESPANAGSPGGVGVAEAPASAPTRVVPRAPDRSAAGADARYDPAGPAGAPTTSGDAFFSAIARQLFQANDAAAAAAGPDAVRRIVDVRFSIDRGGRVMRVWLPKPMDQPALNRQAIERVWRASPFPQLSPDMPQQALELTFPVVVVFAAP